MSALKNAVDKGPPRFRKRCIWVTPPDLTTPNVKRWRDGIRRRQEQQKRLIALQINDTDRARRPGRNSDRAENLANAVGHIERDPAGSVEHLQA